MKTIYYDVNIVVQLIIALHYYAIGEFQVN